MDDATDSDVRRKKDGGTAAIQARVREARARAEVHALRDDLRGDKAAVCIETAVRGRLSRKRTAAVDARKASGDASGTRECPTLAATSPMSQAFPSQEWREGNESHNTGVSRSDNTSARGSREVEANVSAQVQTAEKECPAAAVASVEALGVLGVRAFFNSLGLEAYADRLCCPRRNSPSIRKDEKVTGVDNGDIDDKDDRGKDDATSSAGIEGVHLARIMQAEDPDAEMLAVGVRARLHRIKIMNALGIRHRSEGGACGHKVVPNHCSARSGGPTTLVSSAPAIPYVAAVASTQMVQRLIREQEIVSDTLRKMRRKPGSSGSDRIAESVCGKGETDFLDVEEKERKSTDDAGCIRRVGAPVESPAISACGVGRANVPEHGRAPVGSKGLVSQSFFLASVGLLSELERAVSAQVALTSQVRRYRVYCVCLQYYDLIVPPFGSGSRFLGRMNRAFCLSSFRRIVPFPWQIVASKET